jgi:hypothetical protein
MKRIDILKISLGLIRIQKGKKPRIRALVMSRARILGKMDYFYFLRHMYETCL